MSSSRRTATDGGRQPGPSPHDPRRPAPRDRAGTAASTCSLSVSSRFEPTPSTTSSSRGRAGAAAFKAIRGEYGSGKTFVARWLGERAKRRGFAIAEVQISETETPLHRLETVYRRLCERLATASDPPSALRPVLDAWLYALEEDVLADGAVSPSDDAEALGRAVDALLERRLGDVGRTAPGFAAALRGYRRAAPPVTTETADGARRLARRAAARRGRRQARRRRQGRPRPLRRARFLQGLLTVLRDAGHPGLVLVLDEVETLQRVRTDARDKALNALRQLIDEVDGGRFPGLYLVITGHPRSSTARRASQRLPPLAQRLHTDFATDPRFDNPRAVRSGCPASTSIGSSRSAAGCATSTPAAHADPAGSRPSSTTPTSPRWPGRRRRARRQGRRRAAGLPAKLVADVLDRVDQFADFDPRRDYAPDGQRRRADRRRTPAAAASPTTSSWTSTGP